MLTFAARNKNVLWNEAGGRLEIALNTSKANELTL